ncbi:MAG: SPOR domain-containing protein [Rhodospirillales bacterium]|nr:SPOR domain-containing protein [Rhodospirillales bacterium]
MAPNPEDRLATTEGLEFEPVPSRPKPKRHWGRWVSFAVVVVVGAGGGWYYFGDQLPMNQEKSVPLIQADISPVKIKPADPGGMEVLDRDKLVYDRLKGEGAGTTVEHLLPPPEVPIPIPEDQLQNDTPETALAPQSMVPESGETAMIGTQSTTEEMTAALSQQSSSAEENAPVPLQPILQPPPAPVELAAAPALPQPTALEPAQPAAEPVATQTAQETVTQTVQATTQFQSAVSTEQTKDYRIQLAALRTHERAETEWKRQKKAHPDILGALKLFVVRVDLGEDKGVFFRLRAGPLKDVAAAKALCGELAKRNVGCLVIRPEK